ncbi:MAG: SDR family oxidoreductase, partial [Myxococcales bacterium]|nr:SDR family oxidoreductase [Myxococcales bacterium]
GYVRVDDAERDVVRCLRVNTRGPLVLAAACARRGIALSTFSSDLVFGGDKRDAYVESDAPSPLNVYGLSKLEAEREVRRVYPSALIVRTSAFFGPWDEFNFVTQTLAALARGEAVRAAADQVVSPTYVPDLADAVLDLVIDGARGVWHVANRGACSWAELGKLAARQAGLDGDLVEPCSSAALGLVAARPAYSALGSERGGSLASVDDALVRYLSATAPAEGAGRSICGGEPCASS